MPCASRCPVDLPRGTRPLRSLRRRMRRAAIVFGLLACVGTVHAGDCTVSTSPVVFGSYDPITITSPIDVNGNVQVNCAPTTLTEILLGVYVTIALNQGSSGTFAARTMRQPPASVLQYNLYTSAARNTVWGNGSGGTQTVAGTVGGLLSGQPTPRSFPVYGRLPAGQDPNLGLHNDLITVTVAF